MSLEISESENRTVISVNRSNDAFVIGPTAYIVIYQTPGSKGLTDNLMNT
jgi:hypothetical protein